jgi:Rhodopirellula transposase DDE domain
MRGRAAPGPGARPFITHQVIVNLFAATTTKARLRVRGHVDPRTYAKGRRVSDAQLAEVHLAPNAFHGELRRSFVGSATPAPWVAPSLSSARPPLGAGRVGSLFGP